MFTSNLHYINLEQNGCKEKPFLKNLTTARVCSCIGNILTRSKITDGLVCTVQVVCYSQHASTQGKKLFKNCKISQVA